RSMLLNLQLPQAVRGFCGILAAVVTKNYHANYEELARAWQAQGRRLIVVTPRQHDLEKSVPNAILLGHVTIPNDGEPEHSFDRRPRTTKARPVEAWLFQIPVPPA